MAPVGTETPFHVKPICRQSWGYHAMKVWYFSPSLKHYRVIKTVTYTGDVRLTDTFKFKHHSIKTPTVNPADKMLKAKQALALTIQ